MKQFQLKLDAYDLLVEEPRDDLDFNHPLHEIDMLDHLLNGRDELFLSLLGSDNVDVIGTRLQDLCYLTKRLPIRRHHL